MTLTGNHFGIGNFGDGTLTLNNTTVSENDGWGIWSEGPLATTNATVSMNGDAGVWTVAVASVTNSTFTGNGIGIRAQAGLRIANSVLADGCEIEEITDSGGSNIQSPGDTCGFDQPTDQANATVEQLNLQPLADNGGPTMTHAVGEGSVAIDVIPVAECLDQDGEPLTTDRRGFPRPGGSTCDVGAFEVQR